MLSKEELLKKAGVAVARKIQRPVFDHVCPGCEEVIHEKSSRPKMDGRDLAKDENGDLISIHCCGAEYVEETTPEERIERQKRLDELNAWFGQGSKQASVKVAEARKVIAVDLDGTLAHKDPGPFDPAVIGKPIKKMMDDVKAWIEEGHTVIIFTARADDPKNIPPVKAWLKEQGLGDLKVTCRKTPDISEIHDDRAVTRERNTGEVLTTELPEPDEIKKARVPTAVIVKGNPDVLKSDQWKEQASRFYDDMAAILKDQGYEVSFDDGLPHTEPKHADLWVGHSRGQDRLRFAPKGVRTVAIDDLLDPSHLDDKGNPTAAHFTITPKIGEALRRAPIFDITDADPDTAARHVDRMNRLPERGKGVRWVNSLDELVDGIKQRGRGAIAAQAHEEALDDEGVKKASAAPVPTTGPAAIAHALRALNLDKLEQEAMEIVKSGKKTKRPNAIAILNAVKGMRRNDLTPSDLLLSKVPIMPAKFRPYITVGSTLTLGDTNELIRDLIQTREARRKVIEQMGEENAGDLNLAMYDATAAFMGYGDPVNPKSQQRGVKGVLHKISGEGPKWSWLNSKMIAKPQDNVGRSVVTANPDLGMDEVGIPEEMAWGMFSARIQGELVKKGMGGVDALKAIKDKTADAKKVLDWGIDPKGGGWPVVYSRAPAWHQFNTIAGWAKLHPGKDVQVSPLVSTGMTLDHDGDSGRFILRIKEKTRSRVKKKKDGEVMLHEQPIITNSKIIHIKEFPRIAESKKQLSATVTEFTVPDGVTVYALDPTTGKHGWYPVTHFSEHQDLRMMSVPVGDTTVVCSADHSLIAYKDGVIQPVMPEEAEGLLAPRIHSTPVHPDRIEKSVTATGQQGTAGGKHFKEMMFELPLNRDTGIFLGMLIGDGCVNVAGTVYLYGKGEKAENRHVFESIVRSPNLPYAGYTGESKFISPSLAGVDRERERTVVSDAGWFSRWLKLQTGDGALSKTIPSFSLNASEEHLIGLFDGLMSTDGNISWTVKKGRASGGQLIMSYSTSSADLVITFQTLCRRLGITTSVTPYKSQTSGKDAFIINIGTPSVLKLHQRTPLSFSHPGKNRIFQERSGSVSLTNVRGDSVPYPAHLHDTIKQCWIAHNNYAKLPNGKTDTGLLATAKCRGSWAREAAREHLEICRAAGQWYPEMESYLALVNDAEVKWDRIGKATYIGQMTGWDITVPGPLTFALENGLIVQDTVNVHAYVTPEAIEEAKTKLMPSRMVFSGRDFVTPVNAPKHEQILGVYDAQTGPGSGVAKRFPTRSAFIKAYDAGDIDPDDDVEWDSET